MMPGASAIPQQAQLLQHGQQVLQTVVHKPVLAPPGQVCGFQPGERVRLKGLSQGAPYFGQTFVVDTPNCGNGQARVKLEGSETVMIMAPQYLESASATSADASSVHGQAIGHTPAWLAQASQSQLQPQPQQQQQAVDGNGNVLQVGDLVRLRGKSQYDGQVFTLEATDVGDGRVRISLQLSETAVTRMAFDPAHLELATVTSAPMPQVLHGEQPPLQTAAPQVVYASQPQAARLVAGPAAAAAAGQPEVAYQGATTAALFPQPMA